MYTAATEISAEQHVMLNNNNNVDLATGYLTRGWTRQQQQWGMYLNKGKSSYFIIWICI